MPRRARSGSPDLVLVVSGALIAALTWHAPYAGAFDRTLLVIALQLALFALAAVAVLRRPSSRLTLAIVLAFAGLFRLAALDYTPFLSSDVYRYVWDGRVQAAGINPYVHLPSDPALAHLRDEIVYENMNRRDTARTIYPPLAEVFFYGVTRVHDSVFAMRVALTIADAAAIAGIVLLLGWLSLPRARVLLFAWHPLAVWEIASSGHLDAVVLAAMAGAFLAHERGRSRLAVVIVTLAGLVKIYPLALLPVFWRRWDWISIAIVGLMAAAAYTPYAIGAGWAVLGYLPGYLVEEGFQTGDRFFLIDLLRRAAGFSISPVVYMTAAAIALAGLVVWTIARGPATGAGQVRRILIVATAATLAVSPSYPWYFLWLLPCLPIVPSASLLVLTGAGFIQYVRYVPGTTATGFDLNVVQYGGFVIAAAGLAVARLARGRPARAIRPGDAA